MIDPEVKMVLNTLTESLEKSNQVTAQLAGVAAHLAETVFVQDTVLRAFLAHYFITRPDGKADLQLFIDSQLTGFRTFHKQGALNEQRLQAFENLFEEINEAVLENGYAAYIESLDEEGPVN
jgi:GTP cyclohydrolase I